MSEYELVKRVEELVGDKYLVKTRDDRPSTFSAVFFVKLDILLKKDLTKGITCYGETRIIDDLDKRIEKAGVMGLLLYNIPRTFNTVSDVRAEIYKDMKEYLLKNSFDEEFLKLNLNK
jgi:hypothetical protein